MRVLLPFLFAVVALPVQTRAAEVVPTPAFRSIDLRGGGDVTIVRGPVQRVTIVQGSSQYTHIYLAKEGQLRIDACNSRCPNHYPLQIRIESPTVPSVAISGGGTITAAGGFAAQSKLAAAIQGGGRIDLRNVDARDVAAAIHGGGQILVRPRSSLEAAVNGGGEIRYSGNPSVTMAVNGGGNVSRAN